MNPIPRPNAHKPRNRISRSSLDSLRPHLLQRKRRHRRSWSIRSILVRPRQTIPEHNNIRSPEVRRTRLHTRQQRRPFTSRKRKIHPRRTSTLRSLRSQQIAMSINKEKPISPASTKRQTAPQKNAAIAAHHYREFPLIEQGPNPASQLNTVFPNRRSIANLRRRIDPRLILRRRNRPRVLRLQSRNQPMLSKHLRHIARARLFTHRRRLQPQVRRSAQHRNSAPRRSLR